MLVWFVLGWALVIYLKVPVVGVAVFGIFFAVIYYLYFARMEQEA
jgi:mannose/fructose/N-acetylgalactosamine-specific phosphotransferase system component IIC